MIGTEILKEIIKSNEEYILNNIKNIIKREQTFSPPGIHKVNIIYGVRRSGKTFLLYQLFKANSPNSLYIDFEDERLKNIVSSDFEKVKEAFFEMKPSLLEQKEIFFLFDEIQDIEGWEKFVRRIVEKERIGVYVAGSSSTITPLKIHTALRGRAWSIALYPFSFVEFLRTKNIALADSFYGKTKIIIKKYLLDYLKWGGFPEISFLESDFSRTKILKEYMDAMFFKDLVEKFHVTNILLLESLKEGLFSSFSAKFSLSSFYKNYKQKFPFSKDSLFSYYKHFLDSMLIFETRIFSTSAYKRTRNLPKIYLVDTSLARRVTSLDSGRLLENAVFLELKRKGFEIFYYQEEGECDFIVKKDGNKPEAIQVTWELQDRNREREIKSLVRCCKSLGIKRGTIITYDQDEAIAEDNIKINVIPFWKWII